MQLKTSAVASVSGVAAAAVQAQSLTDLDLLPIINGQASSDRMRIAQIHSKACSRYKTLKLCSSCASICSLKSGISICGCVTNGKAVCQSLLLQSFFNDIVTPSLCVASTSTHPMLPSTAASRHCFVITTNTTVQENITPMPCNLSNLLQCITIDYNRLQSITT